MTSSSHPSGPREGVEFTADFVSAVVGGAWLRPPQGPLCLQGVGIDSREDLGGGLFIALRGERHDGHDHLSAAAAAGAVAALVEREVDVTALPPGMAVLRVERTLAALQSLAAAWRRTLAPVVVGITGSAGKTTTRRLVHAALAGTLRAVQSAKSFNNHLGVPLTLLAAGPRQQVVVAEIGMNAPGEIAALSELAQPEIGVITSIGHAHLEGVGSLAGVAREKSDLLRRIRRGACPALAVAAADAPLLRQYLVGVPALRLCGESLDSALRLAGRRVLPPGGSAAQEIEVVDGALGAAPLLVRLRLPGRHNALNALAAIAVARHLGVDDRSIIEGLESVEPEAMRFEAMLLHRGPGEEPTLLINDAYNANPESMAAALATFGERFAAAPGRRLLLADMLELGQAGPALHGELSTAIAALDRAAPLDAVHLVGPLMRHAAARLEELWGRGAQGRLIHHSALQPEVIEAFVRDVRPGDAVLLKGSRGMALERVAAALAERCASDRPPTAASSH
jgi:UDP-N-acetylmuramoyl-tripeptide--D-alanyl-D-alanine ligase